MKDIDQLHTLSLSDVLKWVRSIYWDVQTERWVLEWTHTHTHHTCWAPQEHAWTQVFTSQIQNADLNIRGTLFCSLRKDISIKGHEETCAFALVTSGL